MVDPAGKKTKATCKKLNRAVFPGKSVIRGPFSSGGADWGSSGASGHHAVGFCFGRWRHRLLISFKRLQEGDGGCSGSSSFVSVGLNVSCYLNSQSFYHSALQQPHCDFRLVNPRVFKLCFFLCDIFKKDLRMTTFIRFLS